MSEDEKKETFPAFVSGSQRYGTPTEKSDIDLVVLLEDDDDQFDLLGNEGESDGGDSDPGEECEMTEGRVMSLRFGNLNLIVVDKKLYRAWKDATDELVAQKPVTRDEAIAVHRKHRAKVGEETK